MKTVQAGAHYTTITVDTAEAVKFSFPSTSLSVEAAGGDITVALTETAQAGDDETITVPDGESRMFIHHRMNIDTYYLTGSGVATLYASNMGDVNPFKAGKRGGDSGGYSETVLWENTGETNPDTITLSEAYTGFDALAIRIRFGSDNDTHTSLLSTSLLTVGWNELLWGVGSGIVGNYIITSTSVFTKNAVTGAYIINKIIGIKYGSYSRVQIGEDPVARAEIAEVEAYIGYNDDTIIGLQADFENSTFTRLAGAKNKNAGADFNVFNMYGGRRLCNLADDGTVNAWYGDDNYTEDGSNGQVMVYQPKFYYKVVPLKLQKNTDYTGAKGYHILKANYYLSDTPKSGFRVHPAFINGNGDEVDGIYLSAYEGSIYDTSENEYLKYDSWDVTDNGDDTYTINKYNGHLADVTATTGDKLSSISGVKPASGEFSNLTRPNAEILAVNRGAGWHSINIQVAMMEMLLFIVEYGTFNTQTAIANGVVSFASGTHNEGVFTGSTASLGNGSGKADSTSRLVTDATEYSTTTTNGTTSIRYRGVENDWGNIWKHIIGANIWGNGSMGGGEVYINSDYTYADNKHDGNYAGVGFTLANADGFIKYIGYGNEEFDWVMLCSKIGGSSALPVGDYLYKTSNLNGYHTCLLGGVWYSGTYAGGFYLSAIIGLGYRIRDLGSRLLYIPS